MARSRDVRRPLRGRVVFVIGADDAATRQTALHFSARGAALIVVGRDRHEVLVTAGLCAASGGTSRVLEESHPPLTDSALLGAAARALTHPTDVLVAQSRDDEASTMADTLRELLGPTAFALVVPTRPPGGARAFAEASCAAFEAFVAKGPSNSGPASDTLGRS